MADFKYQFPPQAPEYKFQSLNSNANASYFLFEQAGNLAQGRGHSGEPLAPCWPVETLNPQSPIWWDKPHEERVTQPFATEFSSSTNGQ